MRFAVLVFTDGRPGLVERTMRSFFEQVSLPHDFVGIVVDDSRDDRAGILRRICPGFHIEPPLPDRKRGFGGAIRAGWALVPDGVDFVFHLEDDFTFNRPVNLRDLADVLLERPWLSQVALKRQAWNEEEKRAGGIVELHPDDFADVESSKGPLLEHRRFFTTNPSVYRRSLLSVGWPDCQHSEGHFTHRLLADPSLRFAFWGARADPPWVHHIGEQRAGLGY